MNKKSSRHGGSFVGSLRGCKAAFYVSAVMPQARGMGLCVKRRPGMRLPVRRWPGAIRMMQLRVVSGGPPEVRRTFGRRPIRMSVRRS
jgi:hypothetical protein